MHSPIDQDRWGNTVYLLFSSPLIKNIGCFYLSDLEDRTYYQDQEGEVVNIEQISPDEAYDKIQNDAAVYLDVRTEEEFQEGHASNAVNIPIFFIKDGNRQANPNFLGQVENRFDPDTTLVVGCRTGGRSQQACEILANAGFTELNNIQGGFLGTPEKAGWAALGLPTEP